MSPSFAAYADNLNRVRLRELIDSYAEASRLAKLKPSLIVNPVTKRHYEAASASPAVQ